MQDPFLGSTTLNSSSVGQNLLDLASASQPIGPGTYLFRTTTGTGGPTAFRYDLQVTAVPEPASLSLLTLTGLTMLPRKSKRQRI